MDLEHELAGGGTAWLLYRTYQFVLWPLGTLLAGILGLGLVFPAVGAITIFAIGYFVQRRRLTRVRSGLMMAVAIAIAALAIYYAGSAIAFVWRVVA
jgi:hypothetical protein